MMESVSALFLLLLVISTLVLYLFPFFPAILEWRRKTDAAPPNVHLQDKTIVDYSIRLFQEYIETHFAPLIKEYSQSNSVYKGKNRQGRDYIISAQPGLLSLSAAELANKKTESDIIFCQDGALPGDMRFTHKIYALDSIDVASMSIVNELLSEKNIMLNAGVKVESLISAGDTLTVKDHCTLHKYAVAKNSIHFTHQAEFQYVFAPKIQFGEVTVSLPDAAIDVMSPEITREIVLEKWDIPENSTLTKHLVVKAPLVVHTGCHLTGNIKCYKDLKIEANTCIIGAIIGEDDIIIADNCVIQGPIVSSGTIWIGENCVIGCLNNMTSLVAEKIVIAKGCLVSGMILAKIKGSFGTQI